MALTGAVPDRGRPLEDVAHCAWRHIDTSSGEFTADPLVAPRRVLAGQAQDRITGVLPRGWAARAFPRVGPRTLADTSHAIRIRRGI
jgi:hypothetical protein